MPSFVYRSLGLTKNSIPLIIYLSSTTSDPSNPQLETDSPITVQRNRRAAVESARSRSRTTVKWFHSRINKSPMNGMPMHEEVLLFVSNLSFPSPTRYFTDHRFGTVPPCMVQRVFQPLPDTVCPFPVRLIFRIGEQRSQRKAEGTIATTTMRCY